MGAYLKAIYDICEGLSLAYLVFGGFSLGFLLLLCLNFFVLASDRLSFLLRWLSFILLFCYVKLGLDFVFAGGFSVYILSFLLVLWAEFTYAYIRAELYSRRNVLPFSGFVSCENAWRPNREFYQLKLDIEAEGFERIASYKAKPLNLATLFYSDSERIALLVIFNMYRGKLRTSYYLCAKKGETYEIFARDNTENMLVLGDNYNISYSNFASFETLLAMLRDKEDSESFVDFKKESLDLVHIFHRDNAFEGTLKGLYSKNRERGQLLTAEGKFQFSKNLIITKYFRI
ncbi:MAG: hypothetical protein R3Y46_02540 [Opitutales bacterium]